MWAEKLTKFGLVHILFIIFAVICFGFGIFFGYRFRGERNANKRDRIATVAGIILLSTEIFRVVYSICVGEMLDLVSFQICFLPIYLLPLFSVFKKGFIKDCLVGHVAYVNTVGCIGYFVNPSALFKTNYVIISLQSGLFHSVLLGVCAFVFFSYDEFGKKGIKDFLKGFGLFIIFTLIAVSANFIIYHVNPNSNLNLFYLYPYSVETYPILDTLIRPNVPYPIYYFCFLCLYFVLSFVPYFAFVIIDKVKNKILGRAGNGKD